MWKLIRDISHRVLGTGMAWRFRKDASGEFLSANRTRTGQELLALLKGVDAGESWKISSSYFQLLFFSSQIIPKSKENGSG